MPSCPEMPTPMWAAEDKSTVEREVNEGSEDVEEVVKWVTSRRLLLLKVQ